MMQVMKKWKVTATFGNGDTMSVWLYDNFLANVLRTVGSIQFSANGLEQPAAITIREEPVPAAAVGQTTTNPT